MGFLSEANFQAVQNVLPSSVVPVIVGDEATLNSYVDDGTVLAGLVSQTAPSNYVSFSSNILSPQAMLSSKNSSSYLRQALGTKYALTITLFYQ